MQTPTPPQSRDNFRIAIMCALPLEAEMVMLMFDVDWHREKVYLGQVEKDDNAYSIGTIGRHNVVLVHLPGPGNDNSAIAAANMRHSYCKIEVMFVVGICGAAPIHPDTGCEVILGDAIISTAVTRYNDGRQYPDCFLQKKGHDDIPGRVAAAVRAWLRMIQIGPNLERLSSQLMENLRSLNSATEKTFYPGRQKDHLYASSHLHRHYTSSERCPECIPESVVCKKDCISLGCGDEQLLPRSRFSVIESAVQGATHQPKIHFGTYGSSNAVLKSGEHRDFHTTNEKIAAYEMEGAGPWDTFPTVIVKSASDYADSHKHNDFQIYAAAVAAALLRAILEFWKSTDSHLQSAQRDDKSSSPATSTNRLDPGGNGTSTNREKSLQKQSRFMPDGELEEYLEDLQSHVPSGELLNLIKMLSKDSSLLRPGKSYWSYLTTKGHETYGKIFDLISRNSKDTADPQVISLSQYVVCFGSRSPAPSQAINIWRRFGRGTQRPFRKCFFMAFLYMLHVEHYSRQKFEQKEPRMEGDGCLSGDRLIKIRSFAEWLSCPCTATCELRWNFAGPKWGIIDDENRELAAECKMFPHYQEREAQRMCEPGSLVASAYSTEDRQQYNKLCRSCTDSWEALGNVR